MGTVKFNDGDFYLNGQYIGSGKMTEKIVNPKDDRIKFLEEQLVRERARSKKLLNTLNEYEKICETPEELQRLAASAWNKAIELGSIQAKYQILKEKAVTMDVIERAAYDIIRDYVRELDNSGRTSSRYALSQDHAAVTVITTRMVERIKQYMKDR